MTRNQQPDQQPGQQPAAGPVRHGRLKRSNPVTGTLAQLAVVLAVFLVSAAAVAAIAVGQFTSQVAANSIELLPLSLA